MVASEMLWAYGMDGWMPSSVLMLRGNYRSISWKFSCITKLKAIYFIYLLMCLQNRIKHKAAITVYNQCLLLLIAALNFIVCCGHINRYGRILYLWNYTTSRTSLHDFETTKHFVLKQILPQYVVGPMYHVPIHLWSLQQVKHWHHTSRKRVEKIQLWITSFNSFQLFGET